MVLLAVSLLVLFAVLFAVLFVVLFVVVSVLSSHYLFPSPEPSQEQSSKWDKGKLQMKESRPSPSGVPLSGFLLLLWLRRRGQGAL